MALENPRNAAVRTRDRDPDTFIGVSLPFSLGKNGWFKSTKNLSEQTKSNLKNLLLTVKGERVNQPELGCDLFNVLFEPMDDTLGVKIDTAIRESVSKWLPHVIIKNISVDLREEENLVNISLTFSTSVNPGATDSITLNLARAGE
tara:strand:- start:2418 stop:2855 length:438 start_codon:yes stop_codon:yes gene_type:complete